MKILKKSSPLVIVTLVLSLVLSFLLFNSLAEPLMAIPCNSGSCDCGDCDGCWTYAIRFPMPVGEDMLVYGCGCPGLNSCSGTAY